MFAAGDHDLARLRVDADDFGVEAQFDAVLGVELVRPQRQPILRRAAGEIVLRQVGPVDRRRGILAQHDDAAAEAAPPQHLGRRKARRTAADDDDVSEARPSMRRPPRLGLLALFLDENPAVALLDLPAVNRAQAPVRAPPRRCADRSRRDAKGTARCRPTTRPSPSGPW